MVELRCEGVAKSYGSTTVLSDVDLLVPEASLMAILGASGSGKTTLLRVIAGFVRPDRGRVVVGGTIVAAAGQIHLAPERRGLGYVAQEGALYPHLSAGENVAFGLRRSERRAGSRIREVLSLVGLTADHVSRRPHELSGGEQRRVALARALAPRPHLILLDEPFSGLDASLRVETREAVQHALEASGTTAVLVTHDQAEALSMGREVAVLRRGQLVQTAAPQTLYRAPADVDVARFVGDAVVVAGYASKGVVRCPLGQLPLVGEHADGPVETVVRPEQLRVRPLPADGQPTSPPHCAVTGTVVGRIYYGPDTMVRLALNDEHRSQVTAKVFSHEAPDMGDPVEIVVTGSVVAYPLPTGDAVVTGSGPAALRAARDENDETTA